VKAAARSVSVLRFRTGGITCAIAARGVASLAAAASGARRLSDLLGLPAAPEPATHRWLLRLDSGARSLEVLIDGPVEIEELSARDLLERPRALPLPAGHPILGFARRGDDVVVLLDIPSLVDLGS
jgi:hypothetical protein